jgi:exopolysaccharide biosynthesis polyprenyl glycosylphosphotransferase
MTPQLAGRPTIHDWDIGGEDLSYADGTVARLAVVGLPTRLPTADDARERIAAPSRRGALRRLLLLTADVLASSVSLLVLVLLLGGQQVRPIALAGLPAMVFFLKVAGLYDREHMRLVPSTLDEAPTLMQVSGLYVLMVVILQTLFADGRLWGGRIAALWLVSFLALVIGRLSARWLAGCTSPVERCLVIGDHDLTVRIREKLTSSRARAVVIATLPLAAAEADRLEGPDGMRRLVEELGVDRIIIAPEESEPGGATDLIRLARSAGVQVSLLPQTLEMVGSAVEFEDLDGLTMLGVRPFGLPQSSRLLKRAVDIIGTSIGFLVVGPLIALIAVAIRFESEGPVFFRQVRVGRDGRPFRIVKFRSMVVGAEEQKDRLRNLNEIGGGMFKISHDPRVTRVGGFLRRTSLDELPQLFNVLRGEMSLVGPRPLVVEEDALVQGLDRSRLHLTPGMTGPWQVLGTRVPMQEMVGLDYLYVASWSLWLDLKLLLHTVRHVLRRGNV